MKWLFFPRTPACASPLPRKKRRGTMLVVTFFIFLIFGVLALSMVFLSQVYLRLGGFRKVSSQLDYCSENGIKGAFHEFLKRLSQNNSPPVISEELYSELKEKTKKGEKTIAVETLGMNFPLEIRESQGEMVWQSQADCSLDGMDEKEDFFLARFRLVFDAEGGLRNLPQKRSSRLETEIGILGGHVPLAFIPFLVDKNLSPEEKEYFQEKNNIGLSVAAGNLIPPQISFSEGDLIPQEATGLLAKALNIKIFHPQDLSNARLRAALGLEPSDSPVPEGAYLIRNDLGLSGIYIQGDVEEMITAIEEDFQVVSFQMEAGTWILKFSPSQSQTYFLTPEEALSYDFIPLGIIIVNGKVESLGGGEVESDGRVRLIKDEEVPSILQGVNLTLIASDKITISSHLLRQGVTWREGVPYIKEEQAQLIIFSTGQDFLQQEAREGGIVIAEDSPDEVKIQASLAAQGEGFMILGKDKAVRLLGGLQTSDYASGNNRLNLTSLPFSLDTIDSAVDSPRSQSSILFPSFFKTLRWKEY